MNAGTLLAQSEAARAESYSLRHAGKDWRPALVKARDLRQSAAFEDPTRADPAWAQERAKVYPTIDADLLAFYAQQLGPP